MTAQCLFAESQKLRLLLGAAGLTGLGVFAAIRALVLAASRTRRSTAFAAAHPTSGSRAGRQGTHDRQGKNRENRFHDVCFVNEVFVLNDSTCQSAFVARPNPAALAGIKLDHAPFRRDFRGLVLRRRLAAINRAGLGASNTTVAVPHFAPPPENAPPMASSNQPQ